MNIIPGFSDHDIVIIVFKMKVSFTLFLKQTKRNIPLYIKADWQAITNSLQSLESHIQNLSGEHVDAEVLWKQFRDSLLNLTDTHIPHKTYRRHCNMPWVTAQLRRQIRQRNKLHH